LKIITDEATLRKPCEPVALKDGLLLGKELFKVLREHNRQNPRFTGCGLAAPQIGLNKQVCIILLPQLQLTLINPIIVEHSTVEMEVTEGCLSFPRQTVLTKRSLWITIKSENMRVPETFGLKDLKGNFWHSVVISHEVDHISNPPKLFFDRKA
jgi:peptide deformylase